MTQCPVCESRAETVEYVCQVQPYIGEKLAGLRCGGCGLLRFPDNTGDYQHGIATSRFEGELKSLRNATDDRPGREFHMAGMGLEILGRPAAEVSFFGAGLNTDWQWLEREYPQVRTKLVDLENMQDAQHFETIDEATPSDIVIASEVIEHFIEPVAHFASLLRLVRDDGILICSTNIYDGSDVSRHQYPFVPGHVAYWTPLSLVKLASDAGCFVDFRTPEMGLRRGGPRKKYIIFYRSIEVFYRVSLYFGTRMFAPSEKG